MRGQPDLETFGASASRKVRAVQRRRVFNSRKKYDQTTPWSHSFPAQLECSGFYDLTIGKRLTRPCV